MVSSHCQYLINLKLDTIRDVVRDSYVFIHSDSCDFDGLFGLYVSSVLLCGVLYGTISIHVLCQSSSRLSFVETEPVSCTCSFVQHYKPDSKLTINTRVVDVRLSLE